MSDDEAGEVSPSVGEVARLVAELVTSEWPTSEQERVAWFERHGLVADAAAPWWGEHGSQSWRSAGPADGWPAVGWHVFEGEFVGVSWFLWHGLPDDAVTAMAQELRRLIVGVAEEPQEEIRREGGDDRFTAYWETGGRSIDMYLYGSPVLDGELHEQAVVQLHVDHVERARRADDAATAAAADA